MSDIQVVIETDRTGWRDISERCTWEFQTISSGGAWMARVTITAPERDLWRLVEGVYTDALKFYYRGHLIWRGTIADRAITRNELVLAAEGPAMALGDEELWRIYADPEVRNWAPSEDLPDGFGADNNYRVYVEGGGSGAFASGDEGIVEYPEDGVELGADIVRLDAEAEVAFTFGSWIAEVREDDGTVLWTKTASGSETLGLTVDDADGLVVALRATADFEMKPASMTAAKAGAGAGNLGNGSYRYRVTFVDANGESVPSNLARVTISDHTSDGQVELTEIPTGYSGTTARKIYRSEADGDTLYLLTTISDNTTTTYTDNVADGSLGDELEESGGGNYVKLTSVVVRTLYPADSSDVAEALLDDEGFETGTVTDSGIEVDRASYHGRDTALTALADMAALGDGETPWIWMIYSRDEGDLRYFGPWPDDPTWLLLRDDLAGWNLQWDRNSVFNAVRAELPDGWRSDWYTDADSITQWGRRERTLTLRDTSRADAQRQAQIYLEDNKEALRSISCGGQARVRTPAGGLTSAYKIRAGDVIRLRDVIPGQDVDIHIKETKATPSGVDFVPDCADKRLPVILAEMVRRVERTERETRVSSTGGSTSTSGGGGGDMYQSVYDGDEDGQVEAADNADALGGVAAADYLTDAEHTAIGDGAPHHARYTDAEAESVADTQIATHAADDDAHHEVFTPADIDTLAELNAILSDATLDDSGDARDPTDHGHTEPGDGGTVAHASLTGVGTADHHARYTDAEVEAIVAANAVPITRIISATAPLEVSPPDGVLDDDLTLSIDKIGVPLRMDVHGLTMNLGFEMDNGRMLGYNE